MTKRALAFALFALLMAQASFSADPAPECKPVDAPAGFVWRASEGDNPEIADKLIRPHSKAELLELRRRVTKVFFGQATLPKTLPVSVERIADQKLLPQPPAELATVDRLLIDMNRTRAVAYLFTPASPKRMLVIYHAGHEVTFPPAVISRFIQSGYTVAGLYMPLFAENSQYAPVVDVPRIGPMKAIMHEQFKLMESEAFNPLQYFIEPVVAVLNYALRTGRFDSVTMVGLSGGGWTTTIAAALDPRITNSYAVAGSLPLHMRWSDWSSWGDYEQVHPELVKTVAYLELYLLAGSGKGRRHVQVLNKYDTCCFSVSSVPNYVHTVQKRLAGIGPGRYDLFVDDTHAAHAISPCTMTHILADLETQAR